MFKDETKLRFLFMITFCMATTYFGLRYEISTYGIIIFSVSINFLVALFSGYLERIIKNLEEKK